MIKVKKQTRGRGYALSIAEKQMGMITVNTGHAVVEEFSIMAGAKQAPPSSKPGQYPARRSGTLADEGVLFSPHDPRRAARKGIQIYYSKKAWYGNILEHFMHRLGINAILKRIGKKIGKRYIPDVSHDE